MSVQVIHKHVRLGTIPTVMKDGKPCLNRDACDAILGPPIPHAGFQPGPNRHAHNSKISGTRKQHTTSQKNSIKTASPDHVTLAESRMKREHYQAELARIEFEERAGLLIRKDTVKKDAIETARKVRDQLLAIPDRLAAVVAAETDQEKVYTLLAHEIRQSLEALAKYE